MKTCPEDSLHNGGIDQADKFCWKCGVELVDVSPKCGLCGEETSLHDHFCPSCGRPLK